MIKVNNRSIFRGVDMGRVRVKVGNVEIEGDVSDAIKILSALNVIRVTAPSAPAMPSKRHVSLSSIAHLPREMRAEELRKMGYIHLFSHYFLDRENARIIYNAPSRFRIFRKDVIKPLADLYRSVGGDRRKYLRLCPYRSEGQRYTTYRIIRSLDRLGLLGLFK